MTKELAHRQRTTNASSQAGFTMLEVVISTALISIITLAIYSLQNFTLNQEQAVMANYISVDSANRTMEQMVREIRNARGGDNGAYALEILQDQQLAFYCDYDYDGQVERIRYFLEGNTLKKGIIRPTAYPVQYPTSLEKITVVTDDIKNSSSPMFYYYNGNWPTDTATNPLASQNRTSQTRLIGIKLILNSNPAEQKANNEAFSMAEIRMLKDNL